MRALAIPSVHTSGWLDRWRDAMPLEWVGIEWGPCGKWRDIRYLSSQRGLIILAGEVARIAREQRAEVIVAHGAGSILGHVARRLIPNPPALVSLGSTLHKPIAGRLAARGVCLAAQDYGQRFFVGRASGFGLRLPNTYTVPVLRDEAEQYLRSPFVKAAIYRLARNHVFQGTLGKRKAS